jgi:hypothetical protein
VKPSNCMLITSHISLYVLHIRCVRAEPRGPFRRREPGASRLLFLHWLRRSCPGKTRHGASKIFPGCARASA